MSLEPWMKENLSLYMERLSDEELKICRTIFHRLTRQERRRKAEIMQKVAARDYFWGFDHNTWWASVKRAFYLHVAHPILKVRR